ncbi:MAG: BBP7 family outer membrane beta-barrel protein [Planctomycetaceae bacterium]|nr:BBP7 family outer membrane beta-barrel protein [Planctomycetaceae bacterium]
MLRPNLYSLLASVVILISASSQAAAQYGPAPYGGMPYGSYESGHQPFIQMPQSGRQAPIVDHYVESAPALWDDSRPIEHFLTEVSRRSWIRVEYLHWNARDLGNSKIGAPVAGLRTEQFEGFDNLNGGLSVGTSIIEDNGQLSLNNIPGVRGTWGLDLNGGAAELSFFGTSDREDTYANRNIRNFRSPLAPELGNVFSPNVIIPLLNNGGVSDVATLNGIVIDKSIEVSMSSQIWGAEASLLTEAYLPGEGFKWQWLGGFRYLNLDEAWNLDGRYDAGGTVTERVTRVISNTSNHVYGPEVGGRASIVSRWMTLSVTPRIAFALNDNSAAVTSDALGTGIATRYTKSEVDFTTVTQVSFAGEVHLNPHFSLFGGYDFMWMPRITRPYENINWNSQNAPAGGFIPDIQLGKRMKNYVLDGFSVGAVFRY